MTRRDRRRRKIKGRRTRDSSCKIICSISIPNILDDLVNQLAQEMKDEIDREIMAKLYNRGRVL